jgi:hypothetical protein
MLALALSGMATKLPGRFDARETAMGPRSAARTACRVLFCVAVTLVLAGCASSAHAPPPSAQPSSSVAQAGSPTVSASSAAGPGGAGAQNLVADGTVKAALLAAYAAHKGLPLDEVTGPLTGTLYYGIDNASGTYWAVAQFRLTPSAPFDAQVNMQDGGSIGVFSRQGGHSWTVRLGGIPFPCPGDLPADLMSVWGMTSAGSCDAVAASSPAKTQANAANVLDMPAGTYFGVVLYVQLQLDGYGMIQFEPETWQGNSSPASRSHLYYSLDADSSTGAGYWTGTSRSASHEVLGSFDLAFAQRVQNAMVPFTTQPLSGYEVTVSIPAGCSGACSKVAKIIQLNTMAPLPANPDFTEPSP